MKNKTALPRLRFPEFRDLPAWKKTPLEDVVSPVVRQVEKPENPYTGLGIRSHGKGTFLKPFELPEKNAMEYLYEVQSDDLIVNITFAWEGAIAIVKQGDTGALVSHRFPTYTFNRDVAIPEFFQYVILDKHFIYNLGIISPGGAGRNRVLNKNDFLKLTVSIPDVPEQQKIADCLSALDELISAQSEKVAALQTYKKGLMQNLFPAEGESVPRLRFEEFKSAGEWEREELGQLARDFLDGDWIESKDQSTNGIRLIQTGNVGMGEFISKNDSARYISEKTFNRLNCTEIFPNDCLISRLPDPIGRACLVPDIKQRMITAVDCTIVRFDYQKIIPYIFVLYSQTNYYLDKVNSFGSGSTRKRISRENLSHIEIPFPSIPEQQRIAELLSALDEEIHAQGEVLAGLRAHKRGLMQQLFPQETSEVLKTSEV